MRHVLILVGLLAMGCSAPQSHGDADDASAALGAMGTPGCGLARPHPPGGIQLSHSFSEAAGGERSFYLSVPDTYDPGVPHRLIVGFAGTSWLGEQIQPYLGLETTLPEAGEIYVYPDPLWRAFEGWGVLGGWLLGPHAHPAHGADDIEFTRELVELVGDQYCVDANRVMATGHSWGGDMAAVAGCFLGDVFAAVAPAAANRPYWFEPATGELACVGEASVWTFFGQGDTHFSWQDEPGQFGEEQVAFWKAHHQCLDTHTALLTGDGECVQYDGCRQETRYCLYSEATGHDVPSYFSEAVLKWFRNI